MRFVIDSHHHLWDPRVRELPWLSGDQQWASAAELAPLRRPCTLTELTPLAAQAGVNGTVVVQAEFSTAETEELLALSGDLVKAVVGWMDLTAGDVADQVAALRSAPGGAALAGIRHPLLAEPDPDWLARPSVRRGLTALGETGLVFDLALFARQLPGAVECARAVPGLRFVLDHLGNPPVSGPDDGSWATAIRALGALENVTCKLSGAHTPAVERLRPYYETALDAFGADRMMFGSDWPVSTLTLPYAEICDMYRTLVEDLSPSEKAAIFSGTAHQIYLS